MKTNFKCPKCKTQQLIGRRLHAVWTCPNCQNSIVPTNRMKIDGHVPYNKVSRKSKYKQFSQKHA